MSRSSPAVGFHPMGSTDLVFDSRMLTYIRDRCYVEYEFR